MFNTLKYKLNKEYRAYNDKGKIESKQDSLKSIYQAVMNDLTRNHARTKDEMVQTAKSLFQLAESAVKCEVELDMCMPEEEPMEEEQQEYAMEFAYGGV